MSYFTKVHLRNILGNTINPSTEDKQDIANSYLSTISGYVDDIESKLDTLNAKDLASGAKQTTGNGYLSTLVSTVSTSANQDTTNSHLSTISGYVDGIEASLSNINTKQSDGLQKTQISNGTIEAGIRQVSTQVVGTDKGIITNAVIHGATTAGGGSYVDVKVSPSGAIQVGGTIDGVTGMATEAKQDTQITSLGTDGTSPPTIAGTGIRGWLRAIYDKLVAGISILGTVTTTEGDTLHNDAFGRDRVSMTGQRFDGDKLEGNPITLD